MGSTRFGGNPGKLLSSGVFERTARRCLESIAVSSVNLTAGSRYWIAVMAPVGAGTFVEFRDIAPGGGGLESNKLRALTAMPTPGGGRQLGQLAGVRSHRRGRPGPRAAARAARSRAGAGAAPAPTLLPRRHRHRARARAHPAPAPAPTPAPAPAPTPAPAPAPTTSTATVGWSIAADAKVTGYRMSYGPAQSNQYTQKLGAGLLAGNVSSYLVSGLPKGHVYYFAVTSIGASGTESTYSTEATKLVQ